MSVILLHARMGYSHTSFSLGSQLEQQVKKEKRKKIKRKKKEVNVKKYGIIKDAWRRSLSIIPGTLQRH